MSRKFFFIAGEASGDALGASLIQALKRTGQPFEMDGIGGEQMIAAGLKSRVKMDDLCVIGLVEIVSQIPRLNKLINKIVDVIEKSQPDIVVTIDLPDFNFFVARRLKKRGIFKGKIIHYVAPTVWAWRPWRAKFVSGFLDGLMCLFPFEPEYFTKHGLKAEFTGHPIADVEKPQVDKGWFAEKYDSSPEHLKIGVFYGSRPSELQAIAPVLREAMLALHEQYQDIELVIPTLPRMEMEVSNLANELPFETLVLVDHENKWKIFKQCDMAVAVSGTVGLELAYLGVGHCVAYKVNPLTWLMLKAMVKVRYAHLANLILDRPVVPELLQLKCTPFHIARTLLEFIKKPEVISGQQREFAELEKHLRVAEGLKAGDKAAEFILNFDLTSAPVKPAQAKLEKAKAKAAEKPAPAEGAEKPSQKEASQ